MNKTAPETAVGGSKTRKLGIKQADESSISTVKG